MLYAKLINMKGVDYVEENTTFDEVFDMFMSMITDYDFLKFTDNEL